MRVRFPSPAPCDVSRHRNGPEPSLGSGVSLSGSAFGFAGGLVVAAWVEGELAEVGPVREHRLVIRLKQQADHFTDELV
jgi:hypothetical protein